MSDDIVRRALTAIAEGVTELDLEDSDIDGPRATFLAGALALNTTVIHLDLSSAGGQGCVCWRASWVTRHALRVRTRAHRQRIGAFGCDGVGEGAGNKHHVDAGQPGRCARFAGAALWQCEHCAPRRVIRQRYLPQLLRKGVCGTNV